jgi:hypothetical protein
MMRNTNYDGCRRAALISTPRSQRSSPTAYITALTQQRRLAEPESEDILHFHLGGLAEIYGLCPPWPDFNPNGDARPSVGPGSGTCPRALRVLLSPSCQATLAPSISSGSWTDPPDVCQHLMDGLLDTDRSLSIGTDLHSGRPQLDALLRPICVAYDPLIPLSRQLFSPSFGTFA